MKSDSHVLEWLLFIVTGLLTAFFAALYLLTQASVNTTYEAPLVPLNADSSAVSVTEGERLTTLMGCLWCHGEGLGGQKYFAKAEKGFIIVAPDLTAKIRDYSEEEFVRAVRHGIRPDGTSLQIAMPAYSFYDLSDADLQAIMAYIMQLPEQDGFEGGLTLQPIGWYRWLTGKMTPPVASVIDHSAPRLPEGSGASVEHGRYLAQVICTECHSDTGRQVVAIAPDLRIAATYSYEDFVTLMRTGVPRDGRQLDWNMIDASKYRFVLFTDDEIRALYVYFRSLLNLPVEAAS